MTPRLVVDASVAIAWLLGEPALFARAERVLRALTSTRMLVPALWQLEVANVLLTKERQQRLDEARVRQALRHLEGLDCEVDAEAATSTFDRVLPLARRHQLTSYDAACLELAQRKKAPLATLDEALGRAAQREGVEWFDAVVG